MRTDTVIYVTLTVLAGIGLAFTEARENRGTVIIWGTVVYVLLFATAIIVTEQMGWSL